MATFGALGGGNVPVSYKTIAIAASGQTYQQQIIYLYPYYASLTENEKMRSIIKIGTGFLSNVAMATTGIYSSTSISNGDTSVTNEIRMADNINDAVYWRIQTKTDGTIVPNHRTTSTNNNTMELMVLSNY